MEDLAILRDGARTYFARSTRDCPPHLSAPVILIQGIYDLRPELARKIVRHRIFTTVPPSPSVAGIVRVAAKRITTGLDPTDPVLALGSSEELVELRSEAFHFPMPPAVPAPRSSASHADPMSLARELAAQVPRDRALYECDRPVAALLVSRDGSLLAAALNTNARNRTLHAEMNLIRAMGGRLPAGSRLYVTLKPCRMCAGMIHDSAEDLRALRVIYGDEDPGPNARHTALDLSPHSIQSRFAT